MLKLQLILREQEITQFAPFKKLKLNPVYHVPLPLMSAFVLEVMLNVPLFCMKDGKIFVVKIMHGASLTEKAKEEVCLHFLDGRYTLNTVIVTISS